MFQSRSLRSSPGVYLRCSLNSTEKPWKGLACRPARKPSTMNLARRSSRATWRMTSGRRYFSAAAMRSLRVLGHQQQPVGVEETPAVHLVHAAGGVGQELAQAGAQLLDQRGVAVVPAGAVDGEQLGRGDHVPHQPAAVGTILGLLQP